MKPEKKNVEIVYCAYVRCAASSNLIPPRHFVTLSFSILALPGLRSAVKDAAAASIRRLLNLCTSVPVTGLSSGVISYHIVVAGGRAITTRANMDSSHHVTRSRILVQS